MKKVRLQKYLAKQGINSRRKCEELILEGRVKVNNSTVTKLGICIDPLEDLVEFDNKTVKQIPNKVYIILNKPSGYICTQHDPFNRPTIYNLIEDIGTRLNYAGRLDFLSEGLVFLTNDGELIYQLTHPKNKIEKVYRVKIRGFINNDELAILRKGIPLTTNFTTSPCNATILKKFKTSTIMEVTIREGKKRQIRRMFSYLNLKVLRLKRIKIGPMSLGNLKPANYRHLSSNEIKKIKNLY